MVPKSNEMLKGKKEKEKEEQEEEGEEEGRGGVRGEGEEGRGKRELWFLSCFCYREPGILLFTLKISFNLKIIGKWDIIIFLLGSCSEIIVGKSFNCSLKILLDTAKPLLHCNLLVSHDEIDCGSL